MDEDDDDDEDLLEDHDHDYQQQSITNSSPPSAPGRLVVEAQPMDDHDDEQEQTPEQYPLQGQDGGDVETGHHTNSSSKQTLLLLGDLDDSNSTTSSTFDPWWRRSWKSRLAVFTCLLSVVLVVVVVSIVVTNNNYNNQDNSATSNGSANNNPRDPSETTASPAASPTTTASPITSLVPTFVPSARPTVSLAPSQSFQPSQAPSRNVSEIEVLLVTQYSYLMESNVELGGDGSLLEFGTDESTYWMQALRYVERTSVGMPDWRIAQRFRLACIYYATNGIPNDFFVQHLYQFTNGQMMEWMFQWTDGAGSTNECEWAGIVCDTTSRTSGTDEDGSLYGPVTTVNVANMLLTGSFPPQIIVLKETLTELILWNNPVQNVGDAQLWWLGELTNLVRLGLTNTVFTYDQGLPTQFGRLTALERLYLDASQKIFGGPMFEGSIDPSIFENMTELRYLYMDTLNVTGPVPYTLQYLPELRYLHMEHCNFTGPLQDFLSKDGDVFFPSLSTFTLDSNFYLTGTLPETVTHISKLQRLELSNCDLSGELPTDLMLGRITDVRLHGNRFQGSIPVEWGNGTVIVSTMFLHDNDLSGDVPDGLCELRQEQPFRLTRFAVDCGDNSDDDTSGTTIEHEEEVACNTTTCCTCCGPTCNTYP